jgi:His-Xaa-Ser system protein HxsD
LPSIRPTRRMPHTRLMPQAARDPALPPVGIVVDFDSSVQSLGALDAAAYRLIGMATCQIDRVGDRFVCRITRSTSVQKRDSPSDDDLRERFLNLVVDENLRSRVAEKTEGVRNVILALAFGSLAADQKNAG